MIREIARDVIKREAEAVAGLLQRLDQSFDDAVQAIVETEGRVIVTGMGKSGIIGKKIAATLSSTGTPAMFLHPAEAFHGDLGIVTRRDIVLAISKSGDTEELAQLMPAFKRLGIKIILLTGRIACSLAGRCDFVIDCGVSVEAEPSNMIPTASSTAALVMGDAIAIALFRLRGFSTEDFAHLHPGGALGRRLLIRVSDIMHTGDAMPVIERSATVQETLMTMSRGRLGMAIVVNDDHRLAGVFTDGDLRRLSEKDRNFLSYRIEDVMTPNPRTIKSDAILDEVLALCEKHKITVLIVADSDNKPIGVIHLHDILQSKLV